MCICVFVYLYLYLCKNKLSCPPASTHSTAPRSIRVEKPTSGLDKNTKELVRPAWWSPRWGSRWRPRWPAWWWPRWGSQWRWIDGEEWSWPWWASWEHLQSFKEVRPAPDHQVGPEQRPAQVIHLIFHLILHFIFHLTLQLILHLILYLIMYLIFHHLPVHQTSGLNTYYVHFREEECLGLYNREISRGPCTIKFIPPLVHCTMCMYSMHPNPTEG